MRGSDTYKKLLLAGIFAMMFLPMIQEKLHLKKEYPLKGDIRLPENIEFDKEDWFSGYYQEEKEKYINSAFGFRNQFVKLNNQIAYSMFRKAKANGVIIGKETYLYEQSYINAYTGTDFLGKDSIDHTIGRLKFISDTLNKLGKQLLVVFAAGKASFYPEYIPDKYLPVRGPTNYQYMSDEAKKANLNVIDFNKWFVDNKHTSKYPLYPQHGVHWSTYGTALAADSLIRKIEDLRHIDAPELAFDGVVMEQPHDVDYDIADGMNLLFRFKSFDVAYPRMLPVNTNGKTRPKVLVISDSFYWGMYGLGIANCFQDDHFWYYNRQIFPESSSKELLVENVDLGEELAKHDVFVIMATEATLRKISWGFIENAELYYKGLASKNNAPVDAAYQKKVTDLVNYIRTDEKWFSDTKKRARERGVSLDSMLVLEARWNIDHQGK
jgi:hypothetical protein